MDAFNRTLADGTPPPERPAERARDENGRFLPGQPGPALKHGRYSQAVRAGALTDGTTALVEMRDEIITELGGSLGEIQTSLVNRFVEGNAIASYMAARIATEGPLTGKGRARALLTMYLRIVESQIRLAQHLGFERPKPGQPTTRPERPDMSIYTDEELAELTLIMDRAKARAAKPSEEPPEPVEASTDHFRIELPPEERS